LDALCRGYTVLIPKAAEATPRVTVRASLGSTSIVNAGGVKEAGPEQSAVLSIRAGLLRITLSGHTRFTDTVDADIGTVTVQLTVWVNATPRLTGTDAEAVSICHALLLADLSAKAICDVDAGRTTAIKSAETAL